MTHRDDAHIQELLAGYEEVLTVTARALEVAEGVVPENLEAQRREVTAAQAKMVLLRRRISEFKRMFSVH